ncbi:hypothetical protein DPMN_075949 [Dreissena polymorpha]|uniref:Uncharacterized protein n=1 Tax=Dreissena polymorpha TaxID=45954 RepID=A0A9D4BPZ8_DREPO|nr:hypothetical protein DPMN_075949 [Dreissena polymorpha]
MGKSAQLPCGHVFQRIGTIFELNADIIRTNVLTKKYVLTEFHEDWTINVHLRVLKRFYSSHITKNIPTSGGPFIQQTGTIFEFIQYSIIKESRFYYRHKKKNAPP